MKHGLVMRVRDWPFSSFHRDVAAGLFPQDWRASSRRSANSARREWRNKAIAPYDLTLLKLPADCGAPAIVMFLPEAVDFPQALALLRPRCAGKKSVTPARR